MPDWLKKLFSEPETITALIASAAVGFVVSLAHGVVEKRHGGWFGFFRALLTGVSISVIVGLAIQDVVGSETLRLAIVGACTIVSEDIWMGLRTLGAALRRDPFGFIVRVLDAVRGRDVGARGREGG
jgi:hypothetical protein